MFENTKRFKISDFNQNIFAITLLILFGVLISTLPHILWFLKTGDPAWIADNDDLLYLSYTANSYFNDLLNLGDPVLANGGVTKYPWVQFIPPVLLAKLFGLSPVHINIIWRTWAGIAIPLGLYAVLITYTKRTWLSFGIAIILMADVGMLAATLGYKHFITLTQIATNNVGEIFQTFPQLLQQWRIITPGISLPFLLLHIWLLQRAINKSSWDRKILAALSLGCLFYIFFYYWTAAVLALAIALIIDTTNRKTYFWIGIIGSLIGLPQVIQQALIKNTTNNDWLPRSDKFLPIPHFSELLIPTVAIFLICTSIIWVLWKRRDLIYLWSLGFSSLLLTNHQIITGLQIENFHWKFCWGPTISILFIIIILDLLPLLPSWYKSFKFLGIIIVVVYLITGLWLRGLEATQTKESVEITTNYHKYREQRLEQETNKLLPRSVIAGSQEFVNFAVITENQRPFNHYTVQLSSSVDNEEWDQRVTLNSYLLGKDRSTFIDKEEAGFKNNGWGPWARDPQKLAERVNNRQKYFDSILSNPSSAIKKFEVLYVALPANGNKPKYLAQNWRLIQNGQYWQVWERYKNDSLQVN